MVPQSVDGTEKICALPSVSFSAASVIVGFVKPIIQICLFNHEFQEKLSVISFDTISRAGDFNVLIEKIRLLSP